MWTKSNACPVNPTRGNVHTARQQQQQRIEFKDTFNIFHLLLLFLLLLLHRRLRWWYHRDFFLFLYLFSNWSLIVGIFVIARYLLRLYLSCTLTIEQYQSTVDLIVSHFFDSTTNTAQQLITTRHAKEVVVVVLLLVFPAIQPSSSRLIISSTVNLSATRSSQQ